MGAAASVDDTARSALRQALLLGAAVQEPTQVKLRRIQGQAVVRRLADGAHGPGPAAWVRRGRAPGPVAELYAGEQTNLKLACVKRGLETLGRSLLLHFTCIGEQL